MPHSIHTSKWLGMIVDLGFEIHLFPSMGDMPLHQDICNITYYSNIDSADYRRRKVRVQRLVPWMPISKSSLLSRVLRAVFRRLAPGLSDPARRLASVIARVQPDMIHTLETQHAAYLLHRATLIRRPNLPWVHSLWGSDLFLYSQLQAHQDLLRSVMSRVDFLHVECGRDVQTARNLGFEGDLCLHSCFSSGFDLDLAERHRGTPPSKRRVIAVKGYSGWVYRSLVALRALELCADLLKDYKIVIYLAAEDVRISAELIALRTGVHIEIMDGEYLDVLKLLGNSRIALSLSISDGVPSTFLEAMVMGAFPVQSNTACAEEWVTNGETGLLVPPEDPDVVARALRIALTDDKLVDQAAESNWQTANARLTRPKMTRAASEMYAKALEKTATRTTA